MASRFNGCVGRVCNSEVDVPGSRAKRWTQKRCAKPCMRGQNLCKTCYGREEEHLESTAAWEAGPNAHNYKKFKGKKLWHGRYSSTSPTRNLPPWSHIELSQWNIDNRAEDEARQRKKDEADIAKRERELAKEAAKAKKELEAHTAALKRAEREAEMASKRADLERRAAEAKAERERRVAEAALKVARSGTARVAAAATAVATVARRRRSSSVRRSASAKRRAAAARPPAPAGHAYNPFATPPRSSSGSRHSRRRSFSSRHGSGSPKRPAPWSYNGVSPPKSPNPNTMRGIGAQLLSKFPKSSSSNKAVEGNGNVNM
jgi:hypothetical protein